MILEQARDKGRSAGLWVLNSRTVPEKSSWWWDKRLRWCRREGQSIKRVHSKQQLLERNNEWRQRMCFVLLGFKESGMLQWQQPLLCDSERSRTESLTSSVGQIQILMPQTFKSKSHVCWEQLTVHTSICFEVSLSWSSRCHYQCKSFGAFGYMCILIDL